MKKRHKRCEIRHKKRCKSEYCSKYCSKYRSKYHSESRSESYHFGSIIPGVLFPEPRVSFWLLPKIINYWPLSFPFWQSLFDGDLQCKFIQTFLLCQWALDMYLEFPHFLGSISRRQDLSIYRIENWSKQGTCCKL